MHYSAHGKSYVPPMALVCTPENYSGRAATDQVVLKIIYIYLFIYLFNKERIRSLITREWDCSDCPVDNGVNKNHPVARLFKSQ